MNILGIMGNAGVGKDTTAVFAKPAVTVALADKIKRICLDVFGFSLDQLWGPSPERNRPDLRYCRNAELRSQLTAMFGAKYGLTLEAAIRDNVLVKQYEPLLTEAFVTPRDALRTLGTEWGRMHYPDIWVDEVLDVIQQLSAGRWLGYVQAAGLVKLDEPHDWTEHSLVVIPDCRFINEVEAIYRVGGKVIRVRNPRVDPPTTTHVSETEQLEVPDSMLSHVLVNDSDLATLEQRTGSMMEALFPQR